MTTRLIAALFTLTTSTLLAKALPVQKAQVINGTVKMVIVDEKAQNSDASSDYCSVYTQLTLNALGGNRGTATLENRVDGVCEIHVEPRKRVYEISASRGGCGSMVYTAENAFASLRIVDHRTRICNDLQPNLLTMQETSEDGTFSYVNKAGKFKTSLVSLSGRFVNIMAIGGETTGTALETESGLIEVDLTQSNGIIPDEGQLILAKGVYKTVHGVERGAYQVLVIRSLEVL